jgi:hypothetical protein
MGGLRLRVITAVFFVLIMLGGVFGGKIPFLLLFGFINGMCLWEFTGLIFSEDNRQNLIRRSIGVALGWLPYAWLSALNLGIIPDDCWLPMLLTFFPLLFLPFVFELSQGNTQAFQAVGFIFLTTIYIGVPFAILNALAFIARVFDNLLKSFSGASTSSIPNLKGCRFADVSHRTIDKATVHTSGMIAASTDVSASERSVSTGVLLRQRVIHIAVPVDR